MVEGQLNRLQDKYGIDGFKLDGGDPLYYSDSDLCAERTTANGQCEAYARIGLKYRLNEYRACWPASRLHSGFAIKLIAGIQMGLPR